jgi:hypothetical protein
MPIVNVPGVGQVNFPDDMSQKDIINAIENDILKRPKEEPTFLQRAKAAAKRGLEEPVESVSGIGLGLKSALGMKEQAGQQAADIRREAAQPKEGPMPTTWEELEQTYGKEGAIEALKKFPTYVTEQILQSAPSMAAPLAVGAGAAALSGPAAPIVGPLAGLGTYGLQQFGQFMQRQAQEGATGETLAPGKAAAVAAATAPLGYFADRFALGLTKVPAKVLGEGALAELAKRTGASVAGRAATGAGLGILAEAPTEVVEQIAERWQAGLPLDNEDAKREYKEAFFGAAAVGGVGGAAARVLGGAPDIERRPDLMKPEQAPIVAPEQQAPEQVATLPPTAGFTPDQATQLRQESAMQEQARLQEQADMQQAQMQQRQVEGARVAGLPGFTGMPDANRQIIDQARADQVAQIKRDESARKAAINRVMKTTFSADPVMQTIAQQRALEELGVPRAKANEITTADPTKQAELIEAEAPEFIPAERGQKKPRGEALFEVTPEDKKDISDLRDNLASVNKDLKEAQAGKGNLFSYLKGKLIDRPGAFSLADIDKDNKRLRQLYNTKGQGALLEDLVADGALDEYLPFDNRSTIEGFDPQTATEYIAEKLRNGENFNEESSVRLRDLQNQKDQLKSRIDNLTSIPAANYELGQMAEQPREELTEAGLRDLEDDARSIGVDVDSLREELSESMPSASIEEFKGAYQSALFAATSRDQRQDALYSQKGEAAPKADPKQEKMQRELTGKSMIEAAQWAVKNAPNPFAKLTANKTLTMLKELQGRGVTFNFEVQGGNKRSSMLSGAEGVTHFLWAKEGTKVTVFLNGTPVFADQRGYPSGMTYDTLLHELLHVATRTSTKFLPPNHPLIKDLNELFNTVVRKYNADAKAGKLPPVLERYYKRINNVLATPDELISWGMNDKEFQKYLSDIKVGDKTVFSQLIDLVRKLIGMAKPFETALDRLVRTTEGLLELDTEYLQNEMVSQTYSLGKPAPVQKPKPIPMRQQALFQRSTPVMRDTLEVRREGFFFDAKNSPLYQKRSAEDIKYPTKEQTAAAIARNATARKIMQERGNVANGAYVGLRQDLNIKDAPLLAVHQGKESLHEKGAGFFSGDVQTYLPVATIKNVYFKIRQTTREAIAEGREFKSKMGSADGQFVKTDQPNFDGIELRFNPFREHLFVDAMGRAVKYVDEATIVAGRAFARGNIEYYGEEDVPARAGTAPTAARLMGQGEGQIQPIIDEPSGNVSISQQQSLFMQQAAIEDNLQKRAEGFYIRADQSPLYQKRSSSDMPQVTDDMFQRALAMHAKGARVEGKGSKIEPGDYVGVRLDVPIREASKKIFPPSGLPIQSIHKGTRSGIENSKGFFNNPVLKYAPNITIKNVHFKIDQAERAEIATGRKKSPMGSADGQFVRIGDPNFDGIELAFNPKREHLFVDALGRAIKYADEITAMGDRVYARGMIEYYGEEDIPSAGAAPSRAGPMVLETAIQEPLLQAVPDTNDGRVSEGQQQSLFSQQGIPSNVDIRGVSEALFKQAAPTPTPVGEQALEILSGMGREPKAPDPGYVQRVRQSWDNAVDNPKATAQAAQSGFRRYADMIETYAFSSDAALNNQIRREIMDSTLGQEEKIGLLMNTSLSQTVHSDAISNLFLMKGDVRFNKELSKWEGVDSKYNIVNLSKKLDEIAAKYGLTKEQIQLISHTAFEAKRTRSLIRFNDEIDAQVDQLRAMAAEERQKGNAVKASTLSEKASNLKMKQKYIHMTDEDIRAGMTQFELMPELSGAVDIWNGIRGNAVKVLVDSGLWTEEEADFLLSNADYVPFYREDQLEQGKGPKEFMRSLQVQAKERRLKGTDRPVNDIFDNMVRWTQYSINRAVRNRSAVALAQTANAVGLGQEVKSKTDGENVISVWIDGKETFYSMADPMFMQAFQGLESVSIPTIRWAAKLADVLRQSVVLYPMFAVAQIPQDSFAAMFSSGLKPQHALSIPLRAVKEFILTLANKSKTHNELKNFGVVGVRDFTSAMVRNDAEVYAGLKAPPGMFGKIKNTLSHIAMASDNAVRQATYLAAQAQGLSQSEALEKAFEIFNVRRKGSSRMLALAGQLIPFFNAYLAAQTVAYKTITGVGTSPTQRAEAYKILFGTTASVMTLSILYAMMNGDDEDYLNKPTPTRDRLLMIPGSGGMSIPLRSDLFTMPKVIAEHTYLMLTNNGYEDGRKFRDSMTAVLANAFLSPTAVPQAIKPLVEVGINYDFFQYKPLIGVYQKNLETERQFTDSTSELAKVLGGTGVMSPIAIDHIIRGMFGSVGGLVTYATNPFLWTLRGDQSVPRPELSFQDALATMPNASGFISKEYESALRKDFYQLREATGKASSTLADLKQRSPEKIEDYITDEAVRNRLGLAPAVEGIARNLTKIRQTITQITNSEMPADEKARQIKDLREAEREMLKGINLKEMREFAKI